MQRLLMTTNQHFYHTLHSGLRNGIVIKNCGQFTLTKKTISALIQTLKCTTDLIEDLLQGFDYVLMTHLNLDFQNIDQ